MLDGSEYVTDELGTKDLGLLKAWAPKFTCYKE